MKSNYQKSNAPFSLKERLIRKFIGYLIRTAYQSLARKKLEELQLFYSNCADEDKKKTDVLVHQSRCTHCFLCMIKSFERQIYSHEQIISYEKSSPKIWVIIDYVASMERQSERLRVRLEQISTYSTVA